MFERVENFNQYMLRRIPLSCSKCHSKFTVPNLSNNEPTTEFLKAKAYQATLIYPSLYFTSRIEKFETVFVDHFPHVVHVEKVLMRLVMQNLIVKAWQIVTP